MKHIRKIVSFSIAIVMMLSYTAYARYNYAIVLNAFSLTRDSSEIQYTIKKSTSEYTNKDVSLEINTNKPIEGVEGFELSEDNKKLTKLFSENDTNTIVLKDYSGNKKDVTYEINNIDKIPPIIENIENGQTYTVNLKPTYRDNVEIKNIEIEKYGTSLKFNCYIEYYDTSKYKGIDTTNDTIHVWITDKPKGTVKYKYYINNSLKFEGNEAEYTFTNLNKRTEYTVKIEAINKSGEVLDTVSQKIKTRYFDNIIANKEGKKFTVTLQGLEPEVKNAIVTKFSASNRNNIIYEGPKIQSDRSVTSSLVATELTQTVENGYYYIQFHLKDGNDQTIDLVGCNIIFNTNYVETDMSINPYNITQKGYYEVRVYDLAGNETKKEFTIK